MFQFVFILFIVLNLQPQAADADDRIFDQGTFRIVRDGIDSAGQLCQVSYDLYDHTVTNLSITSSYTTNRYLMTSTITQKKTTETARVPAAVEMAKDIYSIATFAWLGGYRGSQSSAIASGLLRTHAITIAGPSLQEPTRVIVEVQDQTTFLFNRTAADAVFDCARL